jgi:hypothetical protein
LRRYIKVPSQLLAVHEGLDAACRALRGRGFAPAALEAAAEAAAGGYVDLLGASVSAGIAAGATLDRLNPAPGAEAHSVVADEIAWAVLAFAKDAGAFIGRTKQGSGGGSGGGGGGGGSCGDGGVAGSAAAAVRRCVEKLAQESAHPMVKLQGFKESHAMQLVGEHRKYTRLSSPRHMKLVKRSVGSGMEDMVSDPVRPISCPFQKIPLTESPNVRPGRDP